MTSLRLTLTSQIRVSNFNNKIAFWTGPKYKETRDRLLIRNVTKADGRRHYMCRAMDMDSPIPGTKMMNITFCTQNMSAEGKKPGTPILELELLSANTATIRVKELINPTKVNVNGKNGKATEYVVQYRQNSSYYYMAANASKSAGSFIVLGLSPGKTYHIRTASKTLNGFGEFSQPITLTTPIDKGTKVSPHVTTWQNSIITIARNLFFPWLSAVHS